MTANFDRFNASFDRARNVLLSALGHHFEAKKQEALHRHRQQLADNSTETTEGVAETLADSRGSSDDVVCDTLSSARDSRKRKNSNDGSDGSDDEERRDGGSAAEKRARSIPTTANWIEGAYPKKSDLSAMIVCYATNLDLFVCFVV